MKILNLLFFLTCLTANSYLFSQAFCEDFDPPRVFNSDYPLNLTPCADPSHWISPAVQSHCNQYPVITGNGNFFTINNDQFQIPGTGIVYSTNVNLNPGNYTFKVNTIHRFAIDRSAVDIGIFGDNIFLGRFTVPLGNTVWVESSIPISIPQPVGSIVLRHLNPPAGNCQMCAYYADYSLDDICILPENCCSLVINDFDLIANDDLEIICKASVLNGVNYTWDFGDQTTGKGAQVQHKYASPGMYNVCVTVYNTQGCCGTFCKTINVLDCLDSFSPDFELNQLNCNTYEIINFGKGIDVYTFQNSSYGFYIDPPYNPYYFNFGNYNKHIAHFSSDGVYNVCIWAMNNSGCRALYCKTVVVNCNNCTQPPQPNFDYQLSVNDPRLVNFNELSSWNPNCRIIQRAWDFGDGKTQIINTGNNNTMINHKYSKPGVYYVCLSVIDECGCVNNICKEVRILCTDAQYRIVRVMCPTESEGICAVCFRLEVADNRGRWVTVSNGNLFTWHRNFKNNVPNGWPRYSNWNTTGAEVSFKFPTTYYEFSLCVVYKPIVPIRACDQIAFCSDWNISCGAFEPPLEQELSDNLNSDLKSVSIQSIFSEYNESNYDYKLYNLEGRQIFKGNLVSLYQFITSQQKNQIGIIEVIGENGKREFRKIIF